MSERSRILVMNRYVRILEICVDRYGRLTRVEQEGRIYELLGIRMLYVRVARLFGESILPSSRELRAMQGRLPANLTSENVVALRERTRYYEVSNLLISLSYMPLIAMCAALRSGLVVYAGVLCVLHGLLVAIERYKRALYGICMEDSAAGSEPLSGTAAPPSVESAQPSAASTATTVPSEKRRSWYFSPRRFETDRFFRALGVERVRKMVITFTSITALAPEQRQRRPRSISGTSLHNLADFDAETRVSEVSHLIGVLLHAPFLILFIARRAPQGLVYILLLLCLDVSFVLLQRATRARLWRVLEKRRASRQ